MLDNKSLWDRVLVDMELAVSKANFTTWFKDTWIERQEDGTVFLSVPNAFVKDWLSKKYHQILLKSLREVGEDIRALDYSVSKDSARRHPPENTARPSFPSGELPLQDLYINKEDNLNPRYTFDTFVIGQFNELANAASQAILRKPLTYNPLFIFGSTGHGKTHLIQAVGNHLKKTYADKKVFYLTSERFANDYINSLNTGKINLFKEKYRKYDVLIMDDVQFISNKDRTQEELFHLFNALYENNKQFIFSSDKHPNFIPNLEERLLSRFNAGMIVEIKPPDFESRLQIFKTKAEQMSVPLTQEVLEYLASAVEGNIRELEGVVNTILCQTQLKNRELSLLEIKTLLKNNASRPKKAIAVKDVVKTIADFYNIEETSIYEKTRKKEVVKPRQVIMYFLREELNISYPSIGEKLGGRDHTTVIHSCEKIKNELKENNTLVQEINQLKSMIC